MKIFDPKKAVKLSTNAREPAVEAFVSPECRPVIYLSRKLMAAETNYLNIEKNPNK